jgi:hypothetical protein
MTFDVLYSLNGGPIVRAAGVSLPLSIPKNPGDTIEAWLSRPGQRAGTPVPPSYFDQVGTDAPAVLLDGISGATWFDVSGNGRHATLGSTSAATTWANGVAVAHDQTQNGVVTLPPFGAITGDFTAEVWARNSNGASHAVILNWLTNNTIASAAHFGGLSYRTNGAMRFLIGNGTGTEIAVEGGSGLNDGAWRHFAGRVAGGEAALFINGAKVAQIAVAPGAAGVQNQPYYIGGKRHGVAERHVNGASAAVAIYGHALSDARIAAHHGAGRAA